MIDDLGPIVDMLASGAYQVQRMPPTEYGPGGRKGTPTTSNTAWAPSVYQFYGPGARVRNLVLNPGASFEVFTPGNAGTTPNWTNIGFGHFQDGTVVWNQIALNPADPLWVASAPSHYNVGQQRYNGTEVYEAITAGDAATSGGPSGRNADITDGTVHWKWIGPRLAAPFTITASVQPLNGADLDRLPEGERTRELRKLYTSVELKGLGSNQEPDRVTIDGAVFEVQQVEGWNELAGFWKVIVSRAGRE